MESRRYYYVEIFGRARPAFYHTLGEGKGTRASVLAAAASEIFVVVEMSLSWGCQD